ncbi:zona pellucida sperm-binding protein 3-like [Thalassophryne amazonica]|uniref:zona pellucida sperm-binding protein 3-like n=1 Tax=Thalassophryne amazonica TaxID=390379 RepID=UPI001471F806|nr:zona pellucida sperm-binding protein 3-like [Thalassophryne amazonica]
MACNLWRWFVVLVAQTQFASLRGSNANSPSGALNVKQPRAGRPRPVAVTCHPDSLQVVVQADLFDPFLLVDRAHLRLGSGLLTDGSPCGAVALGEAQFTIQARLTECGTKLSSTKEKLVYSNVLIYAPKPSADGLDRLDGVTIPVECHYDKKCAVDGVPLHPTWVHSVSTAAAENEMKFELQLMTDDWQLQRDSLAYYVGDPVYFEVSVIVTKHVPLRVYVDHCVATATPDVEAALRYDFIEHGCLIDAYLTNSSARFLPRVNEDRLRFQIDAFRFYHELSNLIYISCYVKAAPVGVAADSQNRACSLIENRWRSVDGNDDACRRCDITCQAENLWTTEPPTTKVDTKTSIVLMNPRQSPVHFMRYHPTIGQSGKTEQHSTGLLKRERTIQLGPLAVL